MKFFQNLKGIQVISVSKFFSPATASAACFSGYVKAPIERFDIDLYTRTGDACQSHMLHVWNIYLHLPHKWPKCIQM